MTNKLKRCTPVGSRIGIRDYGSILRAIQLAPREYADIGAMFKLGMPATREVVNRFHTLKLVHIASWRKPNAKACHVACFAFGPGVDVPRPGVKSGVKRDPKSPRNIKSEVVNLASLLRLMAEPIDKVELAVQSGMTQTNICRIVNHLHYIGLIRIADWRRRDHGGSPAALYEFSEGRDATRPVPEPRKVIEARRRRRARDLAMTVKMIRATAANDDRNEAAA